jgi:quercetin dioxygenase-like cupin family protein
MLSYTYPFTLLLFGWLCTCGPAQLSAQQPATPPDSVNTIFPAGQRIESENFTGPVWVERMLQIDDEEQPVAVGNVTFPPGSRSNWHHHPAGQTLLVLDGVGYYQERGTPVRILRKGQTVQCSPDVEHWHGAAPDRWFVQLAMTKEHPRGRVIWGQPVREEEYLAGTPQEQSLTSDSVSLLDARYQHIATIASLNTLTRMEELKTALGEALDAELTVNECKEVLVHLYAYTGFPRSIQGLRTLMTVVEERRERGISDVVGPEASPIAGDQPKYERGKAVLEELLGRSMEGRSDYGDFAPAVDVFLKEHLFADLFERDVLSYRDREVAVIAALASMEGVEPMLRGHMGIARNLGFSEGELRALLLVVSTD